MFQSPSGETVLKVGFLKDGENFTYKLQVSVPFRGNGLESSQVRFQNFLENEEVSVPFRGNGLESTKM